MFLTHLKEFEKNLKKELKFSDRMLRYIECEVNIDQLIADVIPNLLSLSLPRLAFLRAASLVFFICANK